MDILQLIDRLEDLVDRGWRVPLTDKVAIEEERLLNLLDQMRITIPSEVTEARQAELERDEFVAQAREQAETIRSQAREDAARLLNEHDLQVRAQTSAEATIRHAQVRAERMAQEADRYAEARLRELLQTVETLQHQIASGLQVIEARQSAVGPEAEATGPGDELAAEVDRQGD